MSSSLFSTSSSTRPVWTAAPPTEEETNLQLKSLSFSLVSPWRFRRSKKTPKTMSYDDVEIEDMEWNQELQAYTYPCPCGDLFQITKEDLRLGEEIARCPSCSLYITVIYNLEDFAGDSDQKMKKAVDPPKPIAVA